MAVSSPAATCSNACATGRRHKLQGVRLAGPQPLPPASMVIQRKVSSRGGIQVARQRIQVGFSHAGQTVTIQPGDTTLRIIGQHGELITTVPRTGQRRGHQVQGLRNAHPPARVTGLQQPGGPSSSRPAFSRRAKITV